MWKTCRGQKSGGTGDDLHAKARPCRDGAAVAREVVVKAMLNEQPLPLVGHKVDAGEVGAYIARP